MLLFIITYQRLTLEHLYFSDTLYQAKIIEQGGCFKLRLTKVQLDG